MRLLEMVKTVQVPESVSIMLDGRVITVEGEKGRLVRDFSHAPVTLQKIEKTVEIRTEWPRKKEAAVVGTVSSHIENMIIGVTKGFTYKLKIVFSHFPISVKVEGKNAVVENFTGERGRRLAKIMGETQVTVKSEDVIVQGKNIEEVSQTAANIEQATKVKSKDPRVFLDGIYVYERFEGMET
ncbi:MAG: 50S ribosomal protein L6 [Candidatus Bathyarchaeota archaeon]|nr:50S ribosomal protein L6 [Candidatus Bathyarchaeota archaeon]